MRHNLELTRGVTFSGQVLLKLMERGLSRTQAYELVQSSALEAWRAGRDLEGTLLHNPRIREHLSPHAIRQCLDPERHMRHVDTIFKRVGLS